MTAAMIQTISKMMRIMMKEMKMVLVEEMGVYMKPRIMKKGVGTIFPIFTMKRTLAQGNYSKFANYVYC